MGKVDGAGKRSPRELMKILAPARLAWVEEQALGPPAVRDLARLCRCHDPVIPAMSIARGRHLQHEEIGIARQLLHGLCGGTASSEREHRLPIADPDRKRCQLVRGWCEAQLKIPHPEPTPRTILRDIQAWLKASHSAPARERRVEHSQHLEPSTCGDIDGGGSSRLRSIPVSPGEERGSEHTWCLRAQRDSRIRATRNAEARWVLTESNPAIEQDHMLTIRDGIEKPAGTRVAELRDTEDSEPERHSWKLGSLAILNIMRQQRSLRFTSL